MKWKPEEADIIDYLYDSMNAERKAEFEEYLAENPELLKEINDLRRTQKVLPSFQDEEVIPPVPFNSPSYASSKSYRKWLYPVSIAASIALILVTGYFTNFRMSFNDSGFEIGFIDSTSTQDNLSQEQVEEMIAKRFQNYSSEMNNQLVSIQSDFDDKLLASQSAVDEQIRMASIQSNAAELDDAQVLLFISQLQDENKKMMQNFYKVSADEQKTYLRNILLEYSDYLEEQRQKDIQFIQASLLDLRSDSELKQEETDKILANIISQVNNQNSPYNDRQSLD